MTGRRFNQASSATRRLANEGPLFITDRGKPAHALMSYKHCQTLKGNSHNLADLLALDDAEPDLPERSKELTKGAYFS